MMDLLEALTTQYTGFDTDPQSVCQVLYRLSMNRDSDDFERACVFLEEFTEQYGLQEKINAVADMNQFIASMMARQYNETGSCVQSGVDGLIMDNYIYPLIAMGFTRDELDEHGALGVAFNRHIQYFNNQLPETSIIRYLLHKGCSVNAQAGNGRTAVHWMASDTRHMPYFLSVIPDENESWNPQPQDRNGDTPLHVVVGNRAITAEFQQIWLQLLANGADPNLPASDGKSALDIAREVHPNAIDIMLNQVEEIARRRQEFFARQQASE